MAWSAQAKVTTTFTFDHIQASLLFLSSSFLYFVVFKVSDHSNVTYVVLPSHKKATYVVTTKSILMRNHFNVPFVHIAVVVVMHWMVICAFIQVLIKPTLNILSSDKNHSSFFYREINSEHTIECCGVVSCTIFFIRTMITVLEVQLSRADSILLSSF